MYLWAVGTVGCFGYLLFNQIGRMKRIVSNPVGTFFGDDVAAGGDRVNLFGGFTKGLGSAVVAWFGGVIFAVVLALSIILNVFSYIQQ